MERKYKAFISYRHLPLQMEVAKAVHRRIEHYIIPKNLRRDGVRKVGLVFRDQDELPIAGSLSDNIQTALDNSEFLIVICTPETSDSQWVIREITYFLEHHDRDHVLAVLADGAPEEAFPRQITEVRSEDGDLLSSVEPLAANIVAPTKAKRRKLFQTESLRLLAALIGCPYDALYRREQRYRFRRLAVASAVMLGLASAFVGLLLDRNAKIRDQLQASQINESKSLAALSLTSYKNGDYRQALSNVLAALPSEDDPRPYVPEAEYALTQELPLYRTGSLHYDQSITQSTPVRSMVMSDGTDRLAAADVFDTLRLYDTASGKLLWEKQNVSCSGLTFIDSLQAVYSGGSLFDAATGETIWALESYSALNFSKNEAYFSRYIYDSGVSSLCIGDAKTGKILHQYPVSDKYISWTATAVSDDGLWAAAEYKGSDDLASLVIYDVQADSTTLLSESLPSSSYILDRLMFLDNGDLIHAFAGVKEEHGGVSLYAKDNKWECRFDTKLKLQQDSVYMNGKMILGGVIDLLDHSPTAIVYGSLKNLYLISRETGEILMDKLLPDVLCCGALYQNNTTGLLLENGVVTGCTDSGILSSDLNMYSSTAPYRFSKAAIAGKSYLTSGFAVVNSDYPTTIAILRWHQDETFRRILSEDSETDVSRSRIYASPSGKLMAAIEYDYDTMILSGMLWKAEDEAPQTFSLPCERSFLFEPAEISLTEDGKLIAGDNVYDPKSGTVSGLTPTGQTADELGLYSFEHTNISAYDRKSASVLTTVLLYPSRTELPQVLFWKDTELASSFTFPKDLYQWQLRYICCGTGACGWTVFTTSDVEGEHLEMASVGYACDPKEEKFVTLTHLDREYASVCGMAEEKPVMAALDADGRILLVDLTNDTVLKEIDSGMPATAVGKLLFARNDELLLLCSAAGSLEVYDTETGEKLSSSYFGDLNFNFHGDARYTIMPSADGQQLLIIVNDDLYTEAVMIRLEAEHYNCVGMFIGVAHYLPEKNCVVLKRARSTVFYAPFYSRDDLMTKARAVLEREAK